MYKRRNTWLQRIITISPHINTILQMIAVSINLLAGVFSQDLISWDFLKSYLILGLYYLILTELTVE